MTLMKTASTAAAFSLACAVAGSVQAQTPYTPGNTQGQEIVGALLGALFGQPAVATQTLESSWNRGGRPLSERRTELNARIDAGIRSGSLTRREADQLRADYDALVRLEATYAADRRFTAQEQADLAYRYERLSRSVQAEMQDDDDRDGRWRPLADRWSNFDAQVERALDDRSLNRTEAARLRADFQGLMQLEASYARNGLDARETADLRARYQGLRARLGAPQASPPEAGWASLERRIAQGQRAGVISGAEAVRTRAELGDLTRLEAAYAQDGLTADERAYLERRFDEVSARLPAWR